jgi:hypothetical protein
MRVSDSGIAGFAGDVQRPAKEGREFALHGTVAGPQDILRKERIKKLLALDSGAQQ